jgi:hypothetical protein
VSKLSSTDATVGCEQVVDLVIEEISMVSCKFLARLSAYIAKRKSLAGVKDADKTFGGVNVIIVGDFHQFPPISSGRSAPLYWPCNPSKDSAEELLGRKLYEEFEIVVRLKEQVRVIDPEWLDLPRYVRHGSCRAHHIELLQSLVITNPACRLTDFATPPWNEAVLVTPRHSVRHHWNTVMAQARCREAGTQLFACTAYDIFQDRRLTLAEQFSVATKPKIRGKQNEKAALLNRIELAIGMKVMAAFKP